MPVKIHGKEYKTVAERVAEAHKKHKNNIEIQTELVSWEDGIIIMKAHVIIHDGDNVRHFTDYAYEKEGSSQINKTSALENCATSSIGRALSAAGFGGTEYASANEVSNAIHQQNGVAKPSIHQQDKRDAPMTMKQQGLISKLMKSSCITDEERTKIEGFVHDPNATISVASDTIDTLTKWIDERKELAE